MYCYKMARLDHVDKSWSNAMTILSPSSFLLPWEVVECFLEEAA